MNQLAHLASRFVNTPLLIEPKKFDTIMAAVKHRIGLEGVDVKAYWDDEGEDDSVPQASRKPYSIVDGVAVIPVQGTLMKKTYGLYAWSGCASYQKIQSQIDEALNDGMVRALLLDIDSPGGETTGCFELVDYIYQSRDVKPIWGVANDLAASAAYAIGSACSKLYVTRMGAVGSVGVYALHSSQVGLDSEMGVKYTYIYAGEKKVDGNPHQDLSDSAKADIQAEVDREYDIFTATVARNRGINADVVAGTEAGVYFADNAVPMLADEVGTIDDALSALVASLSDAEPKSFRTAAAAAIQTQGEVSMSKNLTALAAKSDETEDKKMEAEETPKAAVPANEPDGDEEDPEDEEDAKKSKAKAAAPGTLGVVGIAAPAKPSMAIEDIQTIQALCSLANVPEKEALQFISQNLSVAQVREQLVNRRAAESEKHTVNSNHNPKSSGSIQSLEAEAAAFARQNKGITKEKAFAQMLEANPEVYETYSNEHNTRALRSNLERAGFKISQ